MTTTELSAREAPGRVLLLGAFLSATRATRAIGEDLAERLVQRGWKVLTASSFVRPVPRLLDSLASIARHRHGFDVAHIDVYSGRSFRIAETCVALLRRLGKPYLLTLHGGGLPAMADRQPERVAALLRGARSVTSPSRFLQRELHPLHHEIVVVPNPIDLSSYTYRERRPLRAELLWLRAFAQLYRPEDAVEVVRALTRDGIDASLRMVGPDKGDGTLGRVRSTARGIEDRLEITSGGVAKGEVPAVLDASHIFVNTTSVDNTPVSLLEAMASGLPVVTTDAGGLPDLVEAEREALVVAVGAPEDMAGAVRRLLNEPHLASSLARNARAKVEQWDWQHVLPRWEALLSRSCSGKRAA